MEIKTERESGALIACAEGRIDGINVREFEEAITAAIGETESVVIIDLEHLSYISSAGLRTILLTAQNLWKRDAKFALCSLPDSIREIVEVAGFDKVIPVHADRAQAVAALSA